MSSSYRELRALRPVGPSRSGLVIGSLALPAAATTAAQHGLGEPSSSGDRLLLEACRTSDDPGAFLCLRCCVSEPIEQKLRGIQRQFGSDRGLELIEMAALVLDDDGRPLRYSLLSQQPTAAITPFTAQVVCSYNPELSGLPHWARQKVQANPDLKAYLLQHGVLMISDWALLANTSPRRIRQAWARCGAAGLSAERVGALHQAYLQHYAPAKQAHRQAHGRSSGWKPDVAFLRAVAPEQSSTATAEQLWAIAKAVRAFLLGSAACDGFPDGDSDLVADPATLAPAEAPEHSAQELHRLITAALARAGAAAVPAALAADQPRWARDPDRRLAWQLYGEGLSQRAIAERCGHQQAWVSRLLNEKQLAATIATAAAVELRRHPAFAGVSRSVAAAERLVEALRNHLLTPEREGDVAPLRRAVADAFPVPAP